VIRERPLHRGEWRLLAVLGLPTFAYALATTVATTYLPVLAEDFTDSSTLVGMLVAIEGVMALLLAVPAGALSDRVSSLLPFVVFATPVLVLALAAMGFSSSLPFAIVVTVIFFGGYFVAYEPYRALYPDLVDADIVGRAQSSQAVWRGLGTVIAIGAGGTLFVLGEPVPFVAAGVVSAAAVLVFLKRVRKHAEPPRAKDIERSLGAVFREDLPRLKRILVERPELRAFVLGNALWEFSLGALKTFVILYLIIGLGLGTSAAALSVTFAALFIAVGAPVSGVLADRYGARRVMRGALILYGIGLAIPMIFADPMVVALIAPVFAFGGGVVMTLPYALMIPLMNDGDHGLSTGLYSVSRGIGASLGPLAAGVAIELTSGGLFSGTEGYAAVWGVCSLSILLSVPLVSRMQRRASAA
jgi:MFS family permease